MKITMYELLGMIKNGKVPKKIKFNNIYCYYRECKNEYVDYTNKPIIQWDYVVMNSLNEKVEILEEEKKIPEKICTNRIINTKDILEFEMIQNKINAEYTYAINEIIDYLKSKGE